MQVCAARFSPSVHWKLSSSTMVQPPKTYDTGLTFLIVDNSCDMSFIKLVARLSKTPTLREVWNCLLSYEFRAAGCWLPDTHIQQES